MQEFASLIKELGLPTAGMVFMAWLLIKQSKEHQKEIAGLKRESEAQFDELHRESQGRFEAMHEEIRDLTKLVIGVVQENSRAVSVLIQLIQSRA